MVNGATQCNTYSYWSWWWPDEAGPNSCDFLHLFPYSVHLCRIFIFRSFEHTSPSAAPVRRKERSRPRSLSRAWTRLHVSGSAWHAVARAPPYGTKDFKYTRCHCRGWVRRRQVMSGGCPKQTAVHLQEGVLLQALHLLLLGRQGFFGLLCLQRSLRAQWQWSPRIFTTSPVCTSHPESGVNGLLFQTAFQFHLEPQ